MKRFIEDNGLVASSSSSRDCLIAPAAESGPEAVHSAPGVDSTGSDGEEGCSGAEGEDPDYLMVRRSSQLPSLPTMDKSFSVK